MVGRHAQHVEGGLQRLPVQRAARLHILLCGFRHHHDAFRAAIRIGTAEHGHAALAYAGDGADRLLQFIGIDIAAAANDGFLGAPGDIDLIGGDIGIVAGVQPAAVEQLAGLHGIAEIAAGG
ncbi:hypothetical protein D3C72_1376540 [compost metagenome]